MTTQPEALRLATVLTRAVEQEAPDDMIVVARWFVEDAAAELRRLHEVNQELLETLEKLARLGNGERYGNSEGNTIARAAINKAERTTP